MSVLLAEMIGVANAPKRPFAELFHLSLIQMGKERIKMLVRNERAAEKRGF
jgi:hypothetical protein